MAIDFAALNIARALGEMPIEKALARVKVLGLLVTHLQQFDDGQWSCRLREPGQFMGSKGGAFTDDPLDAITSATDQYEREIKSKGDFTYQKRRRFIEAIECNIIARAAWQKRMEEENDGAADLGVDARDDGGDTEDANEL